MKKLLISIVVLLIASTAYALIMMPVVSGPEIASISFPNTGILSTFTGTNGTQPTNFTDIAGDTEIQSNALTGHSTGDSTALWGTGYTNNDMEVYYTISTKPANGQYATMYIANGSYNGYGLVFAAVAGTDTFQLYYLVGGALGSAISASLPQELASGDLIGMKISGSTITIWYKPSAGSWTLLDTEVDATYSDCNQIAIGLSDTVIRIDDFGGGTP